MRPRIRLLSAFLAVAAIALVVAASTTWEPPEVPAPSEMAQTTSAAPRLRENCESSGGTYARTVTCYWTMILDDGRKLAWPWPDPSGGVRRVEKYLRGNAPITVRFWQGRIYEIAVKDGHVYLAYADTAGWERGRQAFWLGIGVLVAVAAVVRVVLQLAELRNAVAAHRWGRFRFTLEAVSGIGALLLPLVGSGRTWWAVTALGLFAAAAGGLGRLVPPSRRVTCEPAIAAPSSSSVRPC